MVAADDLGALRAEPAHAGAARRRLTGLIITAAAVLALDQLTKAVVLRFLAVGEHWPAQPVLGLFSFTHVPNTGVAFGMFQGRSDVFVVLAAIVVSGLVLYYHRLPDHANVVRLALGLQVGGALGNIIDRVRIGHVTDFIDFRIWPVFNLADTAIVTGVLLLGWELWREERRLQPRSVGTDGAEWRVEREGMEP
jgi:signal peptidase II